MLDHLDSVNNRHIMAEPPTLYLFLKYLHVACVSLSGVGFLVRGILALRGSAFIRQTWVRVLPHINDSLLLAAAIGLAAMSRQYPFVADWLTAKIIGLCIYIALGSYALGSARNRSRRHRPLAFFAALAVFGWIVSVALSKDAAVIWHGVGLN
jgi:uncharacterized membrane protein SirB2